MGMCVRMPQIEKKGIQGEKSEYKRSNWRKSDLRKISIKKNIFYQNETNSKTSDLNVGDKAPKVSLFENYDHFLAANVPFLKLYQNGDVHMYATTEKMEEKEFQAKGENIKQTIAM